MRRPLGLYHESLPWEVVVSYTGHDDRWHVEPVQGGLTTLHWSIGMRIGKRPFRKVGYNVEYPRAQDLDAAIALCVAYCEKKMDDYRKFG